MAPKRVNVAVAKAQLPQLIERAAGGEIIILARAGKPRAQLVPLDKQNPQLRVPGKGKRRFEMTERPDAPLPDEVLALFEAALATTTKKRKKTKRGA